MEMLFLSYVNELCIYPRLSFFKLVLLKTQNPLDKPVCFTHADVPLSYVNETMSLLGILPLFKIHVNCYMAWDNSPCACCLKMHVVGKGPGAMQSFEPSPFSN